MKFYYKVSAHIQLSWGINSTKWTYWLLHYSLSEKSAIPKKNKNSYLLSEHLNLYFLVMAEDGWPSTHLKDWNKPTRHRHKKSQQLLPDPLPWRSSRIHQVPHKEQRKWDAVSSLSHSFKIRGTISSNILFNVKVWSNLIYISLINLFTKHFEWKLKGRKHDAHS